MMSDGNDGRPNVGDDIDWSSIDCADDGAIIDDEKCDIQELLGSIEFIDSICPDLEYHEGTASWNDLLFVTSVGQPTCEKKDKAVLESTSADIFLDSADSVFCADVRRSKKVRNVALGPSNRQSKKKVKGLPKRPLSAYNLFFQSERLKIFEEGVMNHERISFQGLAKLVGQRWQVLDEKTRQELRRRSQEDIIRYQNEMKEYREKHSIDPTEVPPKKRSPPNSPKSAKSVMTFPASPRQKRRNGEVTASASFENTTLENGQTLNSASLTFDQTHTMGDILATSKEKMKDVCSRQEEEEKRSEHDSDSSTRNQSRLVSLREPNLRVKSFATLPPLLDRDPPMIGSEAQYEARFQASQASIFGDPIGIHRQSQMYHQIPAHTLQHPMNFAVYTRKSFMNTLPIGKEVKIYDPRTGVRLPYKVEYKCFAMTRFEANTYVTRNSHQGMNGSHYVPLENMLRALPPPGVEVPVPKMHLSYHNRCKR